MHLLAAQPGGIADGSEPVDLGQTPGDIVVLSAADTELANLAAAHADSEAGAPTLRLANLMNLSHNLSVDLHVDQVIAQARLVVVRLLGGVGYWSYGVEQVVDTCRRHRIALALMPGDDTPDPELARLSTLSADATHRLWQYCVQGGPDNARHFLAYAASLIGMEADWAEPVPVPRAGLYWPGVPAPDLEALSRDWVPGWPVAAIIFYRALVQAGSVAPVDTMISALRRNGLNPLPVFAASLKEPVSAGIVAGLLGETSPAVILNATGFAVSSPGADRRPGPLDGPGCPVLQVVFSGGTREAWEAGTAGLSPRDLAMNVALPEVDGRVLAGVASFKTEARYDPQVEASVVTYAPVADRIEHAARLAAGWARLAATPAEERRVAVILANYPNRDGRMANGVGLDTPAGTLVLLRAMREAGYPVGDLPEDGNALMTALSAGPTNALAGRAARTGGVRLPLADYTEHFATLPMAVRRQVTERWGPPRNDPHVVDGAFRLAVLRLGGTVIGVQPARGYNIDPVASYHDPALVPPHHYLAFYAWLSRHFGAHAVIHMGKHGNLEWLPGKALALSEACFPEAAFAPLPHIYPFIVNDPGEGTQAKRRTAAVIIDHLTPPLTRADSYGAHAELERLVDEYYQAAGVDPRRLKLLREQILDQTRAIGLAADCGISSDDDDDSALGKLDNYLCEIKEIQIRDGLHVFGEAPAGDQLVDLLVALTRVPRGDGTGGDASLIRALAADLGLDEDFDPLDCDMGRSWTGARPNALDKGGVWRSQGDTVERLEGLAADLVAGRCATNADWTASNAVLAAIAEHVRPAVESCGRSEVGATLEALDGRFVEPGPSGAPTRGRLEVLPTGRNFYSVDTRMVPTPAAWHLGWKSAGLIIDRYRQEHGEWPRSMALSAWGTANMRTGGDDIAQALALMGVRPRWDAGSNRVVGFEILPASVLDRPRVDVTLRISGFFRDAFPAQIDLLDSAVRAVAALDETDDINPLAAHVRADMAGLESSPSKVEAAKRAGYRIFGSKPGAYGAGLQALIDERGWQDEADLARAYVAWGGYAYGAGSKGAPEHTLFEARLSGVQAVLHNQDNREHDLLDSDDYYQFEGGLAAAVAHHSGDRPAVYHNDHSRPESPKIRSLQEEVGRVVRSRVVNPKWIAGVMRHGYKGAFEMAATVDYLFAFAATTGAVRDHHFDAVYQSYLADAAVLQFLRENNPAAMREMAERLLEAQERGLWRPQSNSSHRMLQDLAAHNPSTVEA